MKHKHHIIPKHMGGTDTKDNIIELSIKKHTEAHKKLFEKHGLWQDELAWKGLAGLMTKEEIVHRQLSEAGKKGAIIGNKVMGLGKGSRPWHKMSDKCKSNLSGNKFGNKKYTVIGPDNEIININGLSEWCRSKDINVKSFHKQVIERKRTHKGYKLI